jgi:carboxypeptidase T
MRYLIALLSIAVLSTAAKFVPQFFNHGVQQHRYMLEVDMRDRSVAQQKIDWLQKNGFDIAGLRWTDNQIEVITTDEGLKLLSENKFNGSILESRVIGEPSRFQIDARYLNPARTEAKLRDLQNRFPQTSRLEQLGTSQNGRPIWGLLVSTTPALNDPKSFEKPTLLVDGVHHAREIMTAEVAMDVAETLLSTQDPQLLDLLKGWNVWVIPMLNVDGSNLVWTVNSWWRKNAHADTGEVFGVDINRNYPYQWANCDGSSEDKYNDAYHGESGNSELETQALVKLAQTVRPTGYLSYHSYSELILYPYGCMGERTGENALHENIAKELSRLLPSDSNPNRFYEAGTAWDLLYGVDGDSMSYMYSEFGATSFSFEINQSFQPNYSLREPTVQKHRKAWSYFLQRLDRNLLTLQVTDANSGNPLPATIKISTIAQVKGEKPFRTNQSGYFFKALEPGQYSLNVSLANGQQKQIQVEMRNQAQKVSLTF